MKRNNRNIEVNIEGESIVIGDLEQMKLTSKTFSIKPKNLKKIDNLALLFIFLLLFIFYLSIIIIYGFFKDIKSILMRKMSELNSNVGLNQNYEKINPYDKNYIYIPIVGTDDIHGTFFPRVNNIKIGNKTLTYKTGGLEYIAKYINIIREEFGSNRVLYLDAGDFFQGGIESVLFDGEIMLDYFNLIGLNGSTVGNHEFDYSREWIESKIKKAKYKILINNIMDNSSHRKYGALGENQKKSHLYEVNLDNGDIIKIGVIGLSFNMKNDKNIPNTWGNRDTWDNITFFSYMTELISESKN